MSDRESNSPIASDFISSPRLRRTKPAIWAIAYICFAIVLLTLNPFRFEAYKPSEWWVWRIGLVDFCQNISLFLPLGILLRHRLKMPFRFCLLGGFVLSLSIESAQLFLTSRTSNYADLISNSAGALLGAMLYRYGPARWSRAAPHLDIALMLIPICWIRSILTLVAWNFIGLLVPNTIAAFALLTAGSLRPHQMLGVLGLWIFVAFAPLIRYGWEQGVVIVLFALVVNWLGNHWNISVRKRCIAMLSLSFSLSLGFCIFWTITDRASAVTFWPNLPRIEVLLSGCTLLCALYGTTGSDRQPPHSPDGLT